MNNLSKVFMGFAAVAMVACSNDEPGKGGAEQPTGPKGDVAYMTIRLNDVNAGSRAVTSPEDYETGTDEENAVTNAQFLFFDAAGAYVGKATPLPTPNFGEYPDDNGNTGNGVKDENNIAFKSETVVVLEDLTGKDYPSYVMTVLNAPSFTAESTMDATAKKLQNWNSSEDGVSFVMTTTSYYDGLTAGDASRHNDAFYYATKVNAGDFRDQIGDTPQNPQSTVDIYVERLAAKVELKTKMTTDKQDSDGLPLYMINATVAGDPNGDGGMGTTNLYVKFNGWALSNVANDSHLSKNIDGFAMTGTGAPFESWNNAGDYRSYWGKSTLYEGFADSKVTRYSWGQIALNNSIKKEINKDADYCNENTMAAYDAVPSQATSVLIAATVCKEDGTGIDLVRFNGLLFETKDYFSYILNAAAADNKLNYYYLTKVTKTPVFEADGVTQAKDEDGELVWDVKEEYKQFGPDQIAFELEGVDEPDSDKAKAVITTVTIPEYDNNGTVTAGTKVFKNTGENEYTELTGSDADIKANLTTFVDGKFKAVEAFNGGKMYYTIPVEHLAATTDKENGGEIEGYYGVVRNHWYKLNINKIERMGRGVFTPGDGTAENPGKPVVPEDPEEFFYLGATINILSWKVVDQDVDL